MGLYYPTKFSLRVVYGRHVVVNDEECYTRFGIAEVDFPIWSRGDVMSSAFTLFSREEG